jgi:hypothetical protein
VREEKRSGLPRFTYAISAMSTVKNRSHTMQYFMKLTMLTDIRKGTRNGRQRWEERQGQAPETEGQATGTQGESEAG